jgi:uncharacterized membrane protein SpoIIM required for sporulation
MKIDDAIRSGFRVLVSRPGGVLPFYLFAGSTTLIIRVPLFIGAALAFIVLLGTGRIAPVISEFQELNIDQLASPDARPNQFQELADALAGLVTPVTIAITVISLLLVLVLLLLTRSIAVAGTFHAVYAVQSDREPLLAGVNGIVRDTLRFIGLQLVQVGLAILVSLPLIYILLTLNGISDVFLAVGYGLLWLLALIAISIALLFAEPAIVIDDVGPLMAIRKSLGFLRSRIDAVIAYIGIVILVGIVAVVVFAVTTFLSISRIFVLLLVLVAFRPYLDAVKTGLYAEDTDIDTAVIGNVNPVSRSVSAFRNGWTQVIRFATNHPIAYVLSFGIFMFGVVIGWIAVSGLNAEISPTTDVRNLFGSFPVDVFVQLAANNWYVAANEVFAGVAFAVPTVTNLLLNGLIVGVVGGMTAPIAFAALVLPHGIIEIPALALAGGVGLHLGRVVWRGIQGRTTTDEVADEIGRAYDVLLGLALLFVIAAFIEAFITPWVGSVVLSALMLGR